MAAITSAADGTWVAGAATTWTGGVAPAEGDTCTIQNTHDVEIDNDITVGADTTTAAIQVAAGGSLFVPNTVAGNYTLTCKGDLKVAGTFNIGTVANPIPAGTTFTIKLNYSASLSDGEFGLLIQAGGTFTCQGSDPWANGLTDPDRCLLAADAAVNATALTVDGAIDWNANDYIVIAPTGTTYSQYEIGQVDSCVGTTLNVKTFAGVGGGLAFAHTGTDTDVQAEIINLTRNIVIMNYDGVIGTPGNVAYVSFETTATVDVDWTEFRYLGENAAGKYGVVINTTSGSCNLNRCSFHHFEDGGIETSTTGNNFTIQNMVGYLLSNSIDRGGLRIGETTLSSWTVNNCWLIGCATSQSGYIYIRSFRGTVSYLRSAGSNGTTILLSYVGSGYTTGGTASYIVAHSSGGYGVNYGGKSVSVNNLVIWHSTSYGLFMSNSRDGTITNLEIYGCGTSGNAQLSIGDGVYNMIIVNPKFSSTTSVTNRYGLALYSYYGHADKNILINPQFSYVSGVRTACVYDVYVIGSYNQCYLVNPNFGASTQNIYFGSMWGLNSEINITKYDETAGDYRSYIWQGTGAVGSIIQTDTTYYATASPSQRLTPSSATYKLESGVVKVPVASGNNPTITVKVRESAALNGNAPRLMVKRNDALGITADAVLDTATNGPDVDVAPGTWETLSGQPGAVSADGVLEFYVDVDGTAGFCGVDDWSVTGNI